MHRRLVAERDEGRAILLVSLELDEILSLSDRILVIYEGRIVGEYGPDVVRGEARNRDDRRGEGAGGVSEARRFEPDGGRSAGLPRGSRPLLYERVGGALVPLAATVLAFFIGGLVVLVTGHNPLTAYKAIFNGTGFNWFFPWVTGDERGAAAKDLQETLRVTTPLMLTAIAVAFAFRCGLFNIGGQGQYWVGFIAALWVGTHLPGTPRPAARRARHRRRDPRRHGLGRDRRRAQATVGAHEVITTIMLNWIAIFGGQYLFELGGPSRAGTARCRART